MTVIRDTYFVLSVNLQLFQLFRDFGLESFESCVYMCVLFSYCLYRVSIIIAHFCMQYAGYFLRSWIDQCLQIYEEVTISESPSSMISYLSTLKTKSSSFLIIVVFGTFDTWRLSEAKGFCIPFVLAHYNNQVSGSWKRIRIVRIYSGSRMQDLIENYNLILDPVLFGLQRIVPVVPPNHTPSTISQGCALFG